MLLEVRILLGIGIKGEKYKGKSRVEVMFVFIFWSGSWLQRCFELVEVIKLYICDLSTLMYVYLNLVRR